MKFIHVGVGGFGGAWVKALKENSDAEVVAMVDISEKALDKACDDTGYNREICFTSLDDALGKISADAAVVVTPPKFHRSAIEPCLKAGLDVITEKPMAEDIDDCISIVKTSRDTGKTCAVSQNYRYSPETWTMAKMIERGDIGEIGQVKIDFFKGIDFGGGFRHEMEHPVLIDMSIHHFDLVRFITGLDAVAVSGVSWNPPWSNYKGDCSSNVVFEMSNEARILYNSSWCAKGDFCDWNGNWQIEGSKGTIVYGQGKLELYKVPVLYKVEETVTVEQESPPLKGQAYVLNDFITAIKAGKPPLTTVFDNIYSVSMVFSAVAAVSTGEKQNVINDAVKPLLS